MTKVTYAADSTAPEKLELVHAPQELKIDLACGQSCKDGFDGVDLPGSRAHIEGALTVLREKGSRTVDEDHQLVALEKSKAAIKHEFNILRFPWPFETASVTELHCSHFVEHIPTEFVDAEGNYVPCGTPGAKDLFFAFFDECYRVLAPGAWMTVIVPCGRSSRGFQDPTHRRFLMAETFFYLSAEWRQMTRLDHYNVQCNFGVDVVHTMMNDLALRAVEVQERAFRSEWNAIIDWHVRLCAKKPGEIPAARPMPSLGPPSTTQVTPR